MILKLILNVLHIFGKTKFKGLNDFQSKNLFVILIFKDDSMAIDVTETLLKIEESVQIEATSECEVRF